MLKVQLQVFRSGSAQEILGTSDPLGDLAEDVVTSYSAVRACVQKMGQQLERVDAHMSMLGKLTRQL